MTFTINTERGPRPGVAGARTFALRLSVVAIVLANSVSACATRATNINIDGSHALSATSPAPLAKGCHVARDREAIRAMAGTFAVSFEFTETEPLTPGYTPRDPYRAAASEVVKVIEDSAQQIVLQHILLLPRSDGPSVALKHWRQDWTFEDRELLEFQGQRVFRRRTLPASEVRCTWSQAVFEVDDGPRYESYGGWIHSQNSSTWTSQETFRPLPRREHTKRSDYDVLIGSNRHIVTANGWIHEQHNRKWVEKLGAALVRERGVNKYTRSELADVAVATDYLESTQSFWADVRSTWNALLNQSEAVVVHHAREAKPLYERLFPLATELSNVEPSERRRRIRETIEPYVQPAPAATRN